jgi:PAS domain S-box-containing protein
LITVWGLFGYHLFNIVPIARDTIFESVQVGVIVVDKSNRIVDFNPTSRRVLGHASGIIGQSLDHFLPEWEAFRRSYSGERGTFTIVRMKVGTGSSIEVRCEVSVSPLADKRGAAIGTLLLLQDVTEKFRAQSEIEARTVALEQANAELKVAWRAAKDSEKVKAEFLAHMSHELRTPLNAILNFAEFLKAGWLGPTTPKQDDALEKIGESGLHLLSLINDVLDITKIEAGMMKLRIEPINDMLEFLAPTIATMQTMLAAKDVVFETDIDPKLPTLYADKRRLTQVLLNLLSNAAKFTEKGSVTFSVKYQGQGPRQEMLFVVADTGPGIAKEDQASIFEPFKQSEYGIEKGGGTGLGIPISAGIVAAHQGRLWLESDPGQGCIFYVAVPLSQPDESVS